ncbi:imidazole glycerol phosphate synthase subunit HisH [Candidatus Falkowbacteria bacterium CG10_big_fil_rev_8_21_14_0_10_43_10]|uniref:Imidazole glycerol phosphate synthase subunit HisH n=1 Tax=Candidatus Falkowbacteria bacterium CG10_big_fil_rev_8_21_14_0_10_43_10 TaxID=1974567 RepID=A0A2H0V261_9BACT|nr:MAG: imidazole glycerol phosphate synthase subunit HisH [Candidatus Falkowbacteria bacterium CG10_big_fil_rev_8_21_14_0_10_43_10]
MRKNSNKIIIIDYGLGNLHSIKKAVDYFTKDWTVSGDPAAVSSARAVILPGVGAFAAGMKGLAERGLIGALREFAGKGKPILGVCLGAQMLLSEGHEFGAHQGLNIIKGKVVKFPELAKGVKIPHIGWNKIYPAKDSWQGTILQDVPAKSDMYFVHSYILQPEDKKNIFTLTNYEGYEFCSAVREENVYGCQFHPEKSGEIGLRIIKNFIYNCHCERSNKELY